MQYINMIRKQPSDKTALITETAVYTYGELWQKAMNIRNNILPDEAVHYIHSTTIADQLCQFLAYSGSMVVPIMATAASMRKPLSVNLEIPPMACMGVMTSGSTGPSKILWRDFASWAHFFPIQNHIFGLTEQTIILCQGSLAFTGNLNLYLGVLSVGGTIVGMDSFHPKTWLSYIDRYQVNAIYLIPAKLFLLPQIAHGVYLTVQHIISGSQAMGKQQAQWLQQIFPHSEVVLYYGASELNYITYIKDTDMTEDRSIVGKPFPGVDVTVDAKTQDIVITTPYHVLNVSVPTSLHDRGYIDTKGNLHFLGRSGDYCNVNGRHVSRYRIEQAVCEHMPVREAAVLVQHRDREDVLTVIAGGATVLITRAMLWKTLRPYLQADEIPKACIVMDRLPKNESGKIDRPALEKYIYFRNRRDVI